MLDKHIKAPYHPAMELRVLRYFLTVAKEGSISRAAHTLHVTQPTLSRQLMALEEELGHKLLKRGSHHVSLTFEGQLLRQRAEEILNMVERTENEFSTSGKTIRGSVYIGAGETYAMHRLAQAARKLHQQHPGTGFHLYSGNQEDVTERLDKGLLDFGLIIQPADISRYNRLPLAEQDVWGVLMRKDSPLAEKAAIRKEALLPRPLLMSQQVMKNPPHDNILLRWFGKEAEHLKLVATYNLIYNASVMVMEGMGYAVTLDRLADCSTTSPLCFRPLEPPVRSGLALVWKKGRPLSAAAEAFLQQIRADQCTTPISASLKQGENEGSPEKDKISSP